MSVRVNLRYTRILEESPYLLEREFALTVTNTECHALAVAKAVTRLLSAYPEASVTWVRTQANVSRETSASEAVARTRAIFIEREDSLVTREETEN